MAQLATQLEIGRRIMRRTFLVIGVVVTFASQAGAQTTNQATNELIDKLLTRIDGLEKRVAELEKENATARLSPAPAAPSQPILPAIAPARVTPVEPAQMSHDQAPTIESGPLSSPLLHIAGFAGIGYSATDLHGPNGGFQPLTMLSPHSGFSEGQFVLQLSS